MCHTSWTVIAVFHIPVFQKLLSAKISVCPQMTEMVLMENILLIILKHSLITSTISQNLPSEMSLGSLHTSIKSIHTRVGYVHEISACWPQPILQAFAQLLQERSLKQWVLIAWRLRLKFTGLQCDMTSPQVHEKWRVGHCIYRDTKQCSLID